MKFIMTIGIPGAGKTTAINMFFPNAHIVSPDSFIGYTKEDPWTQDKAKNAWFLSDKKLFELFQEGEEDILFDATNVRRKYRKKYITMAKDFNYLPVALFINTDVKTCIIRNASREEHRKVPEETIQRMASRLTAPTFEEGFEEIIKFNEDGLYVIMAVNKIYGRKVWQK